MRGQRALGHLWLSLAAFALVALLGPAASATDAHFILILDDSGSMEEGATGLLGNEPGNDPSGFGLAVPQIFHNLLGEFHDPPRLTVFTLPRVLTNVQKPGEALRLEPSNYLKYERKNGTWFDASVKAAVEEARRLGDRPVSIILVTDGNPQTLEDMQSAQARMDEALGAMENLSFSCVLIGANVTDQGLCQGRNTRVSDGRAMARDMTRRLAESMGSLPEDGELSGKGAERILKVGKYVKAVRVMLVGTRSGVDFEAEVIDGQGERHVASVHRTRSVLGRRLSLQTISVDNPRPLERAEWTLRLPKASGDVAFGVILQYDLKVQHEVEIIDNERARVKAWLTFQDRHFKEAEFFDGLGIKAVVELERACEGAKGCEKREEIALERGKDSYFTADIPIQSAKELRTLARFDGRGVKLRSSPLSTPVSQIRRKWDPPELPPELACQIVGQTSTVSLIPVDKVSGKPLTEAEIKEEGLSMTLLIDGKPRPMKRKDNTFTATWKPREAGRVALQARLVTRAGDIDGPKLDAEVAPDLDLPEAAELDFGVVEADCAPQAHCEPLAEALGESGLSSGVDLDISRPAKGGWAALKMSVRQGERVEPLEPGQPVSFKWSSKRPIELCYAPPRCASPPDAGAEQVLIEPVSACLKALGERRREACEAAGGKGCAQIGRLGVSVEARAEVQTTPWLECNLWWILILLGLMLAAFIIYGIVSPHDFPKAAMLQVANQERALRRDPGRPLYSVPHGRKGFYRSATCCFSPEGITVKRSKSHVLMLKAGPGYAILLLPRGSSVERRERKWSRVDPTGSDKDALNETRVAVNELYRINGGEFYFQITS